MKIETTSNWSRADFTAIFKCEFCGAKHKSHGYDDRNFYEYVMPRMECQSCGKKTLDNVETEVQS